VGAIGAWAIPTLQPRRRCNRPSTVFMLSGPSSYPNTPPTPNRPRVRCGSGTLAGLWTPRALDLYGCGWTCVTSDTLPVLQHQMMRDCLPHTGIAPCGKPSVDRLPGREAPRQHAPRNAATQHVEDRVDDLAHPTADRGGSSGSSTDHSASVRSLAKWSPSRLCCARVVAVHIRLFIQLGLDNPLESHPTVTTQPPFR
jgi:hypothetical protein